MTEKKRIHFRTVVVTGATSGFGELLVREFLRNGDLVVATGRRLTQRREVFAAEREKFGARLIERDLDVTLAEERRRLVEFLHTQGPVDILVNNAGYGLFGALEDTDEDQLRAQMEVNFFGAVLLIRELLPALRTSRGKIFNFSSVFGFTGFPQTAAYCASKFAIEGLTESLAYELKPYNVQVCLIEPGGYRTSFSSSEVWARHSTLKNSAYAEQTRAHRTFREKNARRPSRPPQEVAVKVVRLSDCRTLPLRVTMGPDSRGTWLLRRILPGRFFRALIEVFLRRQNLI